MNKCDICAKFGELETTTLEIKKHKECDVNGLFVTKQEPRIYTSSEVKTDIKPFEVPSGAPAYVNAELKKMVV